MYDGDHAEMMVAQCREGRRSIANLKTDGDRGILGYMVRATPATPARDDGGNFGPAESFLSSDISARSPRR